MGQDVSFNLIDEPWVRIRDEEGEEREVSLLELFKQAPHIKCLANDLPTQDFAILRVLLAILQRSILPTLDEDDDPIDVWEDLWNAPELPLDDICRYLDKWRSRFDLFDEENPFMQVAGLRTAKDDYSDIKKIVADIPDGDTLFSLRTGEGAETLSYAEAARWLIHVQAFDTSGIKSGTVGDSRVKSGKSYPIGTGWAGSLGGLYFEGLTLFETLLLNFIACDIDGDDLFSDDDLPCWERSAESAGMDDRFPTGKLDLYTWQSRRVRLIPESGRVVGVVLTNGDKLESINMQQYEPMTAWLNQGKKLKSSPVYVPYIHETDRALWHGLDSVFGNDSSDCYLSIVNSGLKEWVSRLVDEGCLLSRERLLRIRAVGFKYGTKGSVITNLVDDSVELSAFLLSSEGKSLVSLAQECARLTSNAVFELGIFAGNLCLASGGSGAGEIRGAKQGAMARAFFEIDSSFRLWLASLDEDSDANAERDRWRRLARSIIKVSAANLLRGLASGAIVGAPARSGAGKNDGWMTASRAEAIFNAALKKALPLEEDIQAKKEVH